MFDFLNTSALTTDDFNEKTEFVMPNFIAKRMITLVYADGGNGKSWLGLALAKLCADADYKVIYLDFDNPLSVLRERNVDTLLVGQFSNLHYVQLRKCELNAKEMLQRLSDSAKANVFKNAIIVIDSLRNFGDMGNDTVAMKVMDQIMNLRESGATILVLHHANKDGRNYQGSNNIRNSVDNMYQLKKLEVADGIGMYLSVEKERASITDKAFDICPNSFSLTERDLTEAKCSQADLEFINDVKDVLTQSSGINKTTLFKALDIRKDNNQARARLDKYQGVYWNAKKVGREYTYEKI
jgi:archaellum biogenesis ATPase FlaH